MPLDLLTDSGLPLPIPDVQRTTLGLDVLSRFVCNTWDEATAAGTRQFDAVVVGGGMFGGYCADKIYRDGAARGLKVLVLEAGPFVVPTHLQNLPNVALYAPDPLLPANDPHTARNIVWGMPWRGNVPFIGEAYCVGGKSLFWGGWCPRLLAGDLAQWPPDIAAYLSANYSLLEEQTGVNERTDFIQGPLFSLLKNKATAAIGIVPNLDSVDDPPLAVQGQSPASGLFSFDKYSSVTVLIDAVRDAANAPDSSRRLFVVPNAHVTRLLTTGGMVSGVQTSVNGTIKTLNVGPKCAVILAMGTMESTRMALTSFPTSPGNPNNELMGRNLMAHWRSNIFVQIRRSVLDPANTLPTALQTGALLVRGSTPQGEFHLQVTASADPTGNSDALLYTMIPDADQLNTILAAQTTDSVTIAFRGVSQQFGDKTSSVPNATGRWINLSPFESDESGVPRAWVQMTTSSNEDSLANAMDAAILALATQLAGGDASNVNVISRNRDGIGTTYHEAGTLWMGANPSSSVTDTNGRFHNVANAYCSDQSLFVTVGSVNPTLTGLVLSRRVAEAAVALASS
jgi:hypothetical protein